MVFKRLYKRDNMVKKFYYSIVLFFTLFAILSFLGTFYLYEKEKNIAMKLTSTHQYNFYLNEAKYGTINLIQKSIENEYKNLKITYKNKKIKELKKETKHLIHLLNTLNTLGYKNINLFLLNYLYNYPYDIEFINLNNKIVASNDILKIDKNATLNCNPLKNNAQCEFFKNNSEYYLLTYVPSYKLIIKLKTNLSKIPKNYFHPIIENLKNIPGIILFLNGKKIKGKFTNDGFYIFEKFKPLNIFFGFQIKYDQVENLTFELEKELKKAIKPLIGWYIFLFLISILLFYIYLFTFVRKKIIHIDKTISNYQKKATFDTLTGVYNRESFEQAAKTGKYKHLLIIDLDNFKYINDTFGHDTGDYILKEFAWLLKKYFKEDIIGRWGGDEFMILTNKSKYTLEQIFKDINKKIQKIQEEFDKDKKEKLSVSVGVCSDIDAPFEERFKNADLALYKVKKTKKGNVLFFRDIDYIKMEKDDLK
jgi:diguanylate cyclase (GGDEF)-like protein